MSENSLWTQISSPQDLLDSVATYLKVQNFPMNFACDHICYRVETQVRYEQLKGLLKNYGTLANESIVNGRNISIYHLYSPIVFSGIKTDCIELPSPKENSFYQEGWEHAEFAIHQDLKNWIEKYPAVLFDQKDIYKPINAEVSIKISQSYKIKFHEKPILDVIKEEKNHQLKNTASLR